MAKRLSVDDNKNPIQAFKLPTTGQTTSLAVSTTAATTATLPAGMYLFSCPIDCQIALGATVTTGDLDLIGGVQKTYELPATAVSAIAGSSSTLKITLL